MTRERKRERERERERERKETVKEELLLVYEIEDGVK